MTEGQTNGHNGSNTEDRLTNRLQTDQHIDQGTDELRNGKLAGGLNENMKIFNILS